MFEKIYWHTPSRIIVAEYSGRVDLEDFKMATKAIAEAMDADGKPPYVHNIADASQRDELDKSLFNLRTLKEAQTLTEHPLLGWTVVVDENPNPVMKFIGTAIIQLTRNRLHIVTSLDEAIAYLYDVDQTLAK